jgi:hypothetical protein
MKSAFNFKDVVINYSLRTNVWAEYSKKVYTAAQRAASKAIAKSAYRIFRDAQSTIIRDPDPSTPGTPPHTRRGMLRKGIRYQVNYRVPDAVIGPVGSVLADIGELHEFGGERYGSEYPPRPYMQPALDRDLDNFAGDFTGSIGQ